MLTVKFELVMNGNLRAFNSYSFTFVRNIGSPISRKNSH